MNGGRLQLRPVGIREGLLGDAKRATSLLGQPDLGCHGRTMISTRLKSAIPQCWAPQPLPADAMASSRHPTPAVRSTDGAGGVSHPCQRVATYPSVAAIGLNGLNSN